MLTRLDLRSKLGTPGPRRDAWLRRELPRPPMVGEPPVEAVAAILAEVRKGGDQALRALTKRFDHVDIAELRVGADEIAAASATIPPRLHASLQAAHDSILAFQQSTLPGNERYERNGITVRQMWRPVERAGCYVPGGLALYPSTVLMSAVPARVAGVEQIVVCVPPAHDGRIPVSVLAAAAIAGIDEVYCVGGVQAIGAMAYGTESVGAVDVIVGPGNIYVATAKRLVSGMVGVPSSFAGPSEVVVIADDTTLPEYAAIDIIVQAEHGPDGLAWLITWSEQAAARITAAVDALLSTSPRRAQIEATLARGGYAVVVDDPQAAVDVANAVAPEHLELMNEDPEALVPMVRHAGAVFCGPDAPASVGDYIAGPSHVLPVYSSARFGSALGVRDFLRDQHFISLDHDGLAGVADHVAMIADAEGLDAHAQSVRIRTASLPR